jgi:hypothetical protein
VRAQCAQPAAIATWIKVIKFIMVILHGHHLSLHIGTFDLAACSNMQYEVKDGVHGVSYSCSSTSDDGSSWTPVVGRRKKRGPVPE